MDPHIQSENKSFPGQKFCTQLVKWWWHYFSMNVQSHHKCLNIKYFYSRNK